MRSVTVTNRFSRVLAFCTESAGPYYLLIFSIYSQYRMRVSNIAVVIAGIALGSNALEGSSSQWGSGRSGHIWGHSQQKDNQCLSNIIPSEAYVQVDEDPTGFQWPWRVFKSDPNTPPNMTITRADAELAPGYVFMTPWPSNNETHQSGGFIMTVDGEMVYCIPVNGMHDFRVQEFNGSPYLTYCNGLNAPFPQVGKGYGQVTFADSTYKNFSVRPNLRLNTLQEDNPTWTGGQVDIHEAEMTSRNTLLVTAYNNTQYDLSSLNDTSDFWKTAWVRLCISCNTRS